MTDKMFTPAPWEIEEGDDCLQVSGCTVGNIYRIARFDGSHNDAELKANAHLVASAPEMYDALEAISKGEGLPPGSTIEGILSKARGE